MKNRLEIQLIILLLCGLAIAAAWIGIQVARENVGVWSEPAELHFTTGNLPGLAARSQLRSAGVVVGHVRKIESSIRNGAPEFTLVAGVMNEFAAWRFKPTAFIEVGIVQSVLSPNSIRLETGNTPRVFGPVKPRDGAPPRLSLELMKSESDFSSLKERYMNLSKDIENAIKRFTVPQEGRTKSALDEMADALPRLARTAQHLEEISASINGKSPPAGSDPASRPPIAGVLADVKDATSSLAAAAKAIQGTVGEGGGVNSLIQTLKAKLDLLGELIATTDKAVSDLQGRVSRLGLEKSLRKLDGLVDETTATVTTLHGKVEGLGNTFLGRMLIKPAQEPTPTPAKPARKIFRSSR